MKTRNQLVEEFGNEAADEIQKTIALNGGLKWRGIIKNSMHRLLCAADEVDDERSTELLRTLQMRSVKGKH